MRKPDLDPRIISYIYKKLKTRRTQNAIRVAITKLRTKHPSLTLNAAAEIYAKKNGFSVSKYLTDDDRMALRTIQVTVVPIKNRPGVRKKYIQEIATYNTKNALLLRHLEEINKTYTIGCCTATFVLCRKVIENLLIHHIIKKKYPGRSKQDKELYYDINRGRYNDFELILKNLRKKAKDFSEDKKLVERICQLAGEFKDTANDMTHSLYHIASKKELDDRKFQYILDLIQELEGKL